MKTIFFIVVALISTALIWRQINKWTKPLLKASIDLLNESRLLKILLSKLKEGTLLNINDRDIFEIGQAMLIDGSPTIEINKLMIKLSIEKYLNFLSKGFVSNYNIVHEYVGYPDTER